MENNFFYKKFQRKTNSELQQILDKPKSYTQDALLAASQLLKERAVEIKSEQEEVIEKIVTEKKEKEEKENRKPASYPFAKRLAAFFIDLLILSAVSYVIGFIFMGTDLLEGPMEPFISFTLVLGYFSYFNSKLGGGSPGKRLAKIQLLGYDGEMIGIERSKIRYTVLFLPHLLFVLLNNYGVNTFGIHIALYYIFYIGVLYFILTDSPHKRSIHDFISRSFVTEQDNKKIPGEYSKTKRNVFYALATGVIIYAVVTNISYSLPAEVSRYEEMAKTMEASFQKNLPVFEQIITEINSIEGIASVKGIQVSTSNGETSLNITIRPESSSGVNTISSKVMKVINGKTIVGPRIDKVKIISDYGFDMTLATYKKTSTQTIEL